MFPRLLVPNMLRTVAVSAVVASAAGTCAGSSRSTWRDPWQCVCGRLQPQLTAAQAQPRALDCSLTCLQQGIGDVMTTWQSMARVFQSRQGTT